MLWFILIHDIPSPDYGFPNFYEMSSGSLCHFRLVRFRLFSTDDTFSLLCRHVFLTFICTYARKRLCTYFMVKARQILKKKKKALPGRSAAPCVLPNSSQMFCSLSSWDNILKSRNVWRKVQMWAVSSNVLKGLTISNTSGCQHEE